MAEDPACPRGGKGKGREDATLQSQILHGCYEPYHNVIIPIGYFI